VYTKAIAFALIVLPVFAIFALQLGSVSSFFSVAARIFFPTFLLLKK
jgi:hypothetical protein